LTDGNPSRDRILGRMRKALSARPLHPHGPATAPNREAGLYALGIFEPIDDALARFRAECEANRTDLYLVDAENEAARLNEILLQEQRNLPPNPEPGSEQPGIFVQDAPELRRLLEGISAPVHWSSAGPARDSDFTGVTLAEALVARTGSVLISAASGGRTASVLPPVHIVYAQLPQLLAEIGEALDHVQKSGRVRDLSMLGLVTGPSRTSDIEKMLVLGAHGPRRLVILLRC
jgi:L-lactate utilization protein LutC